MMFTRRDRLKQLIKSRKNTNMTNAPKLHKKKVEKVEYGMFRLTAQAHWTSINGEFCEFCGTLTNYDENPYNGLEYTNHPSGPIKSDQDKRYMAAVHALCDHCHYYYDPLDLKR